MKINIDPVLSKLFVHEFFQPSVKTCVLGAQKNRLIQTVLSSTQKRMFWL